MGAAATVGSTAAFAADPPREQHRKSIGNVILSDDGKLAANFRCYEDVSAAESITLRFKVENVMHDERFQPTLNGHPIAADHQTIRYAANGRDTRVHTVKLGPNLEYEVALTPSQLKRGQNRLELVPRVLVPDVITTVELRELELIVRYSD